MTISYVDTGVLPDSEHSYTVDARDSAGAGPSAAASVGVPPLAPTGLVATLTANGIALSWNAIADETQYDLYRDGTILATPATNAYLDAAIAPAETYQYQVGVTTAAGPSALSPVVSVSTPAFAIPANFRATSVGATEIDLAWDAVPGATVYQPFQNGVALAPTAATTLRVTGLKANTQLSFGVYAGGAAGHGVRTTITLRTAVSDPAPVPAVPTSFAASSVTSSSLVLGCDAMAGADLYQWFQNGVALAPTYTPSLPVSGLKAKTTIAFGVYAGNAAGHSARAQISVTTP